MGAATRPRLLNWLELPRAAGGDHLLMAPIRVRDDDDERKTRLDQPSIIDWLHQERARAERARLAYVALTRARRSLHLYVHPRQREAEGERTSAPTRARCCRICGRRSATDIGALPVIRARRQRWSRWPPAARRHGTGCGAAIRRPSPPPDVIARGELVPLGAEEEEIEFSWVRQTARRVGTVVHEALERFGRTSLPEAAELPQLRARLESRLQALGVEADAARAGAERALDGAARHARRTRADAGCSTPAHRDAQSELALTGVRGGHIVNAVIDRTFVDRRHALGRRLQDQSARGRRSRARSSTPKRCATTAQLQRYAHLARELGPRAGARRPVFPAAGRVARSRCRSSRSLRTRTSLRPEASGVAPSVISRTRRSASAVRPVMYPCTR